MTYSFHIKGGDLNPSGPGGLAVVTGQQKLVQDLKHRLLAPQGSDPMHPEYGSTLDGGRLPNGTLVGTNIGETISRERMMGIEAEIRRTMIAQQQQQLDRLKRESIRFNGKNTFSFGEILASIESINVMPIQDVVLAQVYIRTQAGNVLQMSQPVG